MVGFGGETLEALAALARLGGVHSVLLVPWVMLRAVPLVLRAVLGALAMVGPRNAFVCRGLLDSLLLPPVSLLVLVEIASSFDVEPPCSYALDVGLLRSHLFPVVSVAAVNEVSCQCSRPL